MPATHDHLTNGLIDLDGAGARARLIEARGLIKALLDTDLQPAAREAAVAGMAKVDADLAAASRQATVAISCLLDEVTTLQSRRPTPAPVPPPKPPASRPAPARRIPVPTPPLYRPSAPKPLPAPVPASGEISLAARLHSKMRWDDQGRPIPPLNAEDDAIPW